ncbi:protein OBERON 3-like [Solanum pennellii]|uniref:Protein OBERON 3-like n=1 Tax=Solanum pennellii TaxID=28526 RepID=A0ABM1V5Z9_SOLPN|nr:protein OBERON 3-like [Solanum pennellii]XP_027771169.1 protein OBERON 3-like [Solanum pennellii]
MKMQLHMEISGLLSRKEAAKQPLRRFRGKFLKFFLPICQFLISLHIMVSGQSDALRGRGSGYLKRYGGNAHKLTRQANCGKGTIKSVHSSFRPIGDGGVALSNHVGGTWFDSRVVNKETCSDLIHRSTSSDNNLIFLSDLSARPRVVDSQSRDSRKRGSGYLKRLEKRNGGRAYELSRQQTILRRIVSEPIPLMAQIVQQLDDETVESTKEYLRNLITMPERIYEFVSLQNRLDERSDLTNQTLLNCHKIQLEFLVSIRTGLGSFLSGNTRLLTSELVEIFLLERCQNINCRRILPIEDRGCKICSMKKGFCSECMCFVCLKFDCTNNTCSWVECDACLHWCHAVCGIRQKPGPILKGPSGTTEMQFYCLGCGHASEMFGFIKGVFMSCANEWSEDTLMKELDYVQKIFQGSEDFKGKELYVKADVLHTKLVTKMISPSDACKFIFQFFSAIKTIEDEWPVKR